MFGPRKKVIGENYGHEHESESGIAPPKKDRTVKSHIKDVNIM